jgi:hypothetical protein
MQSRYKKAGEAKRPLITGIECISTEAEHEIRASGTAEYCSVFGFLTKFRLQPLEKIPELLLTTVTDH